MSSPVLFITAGPTREPIDDIRFLSNGASGTLGIEIAIAARDAGWTVHLALGPVPHRPLEGIHLHPFVTALDLEKIAIDLWPEVDAMVATAAVGDYRPAQKIDGKRKKSAGDWDLRLVRTRPIGTLSGDRTQRITCWPAPLRGNSKFAIRLVRWMRQPAHMLELKIHFSSPGVDRLGD